MRKIIACIMLALIATSVCSQVNTKQTLTRDEYLKKSKNQKTTAWILLGGGAALITTGVLIGGGKEASLDNAATGGVIAIAGIVSVAGSIPFFISSSKNKKRAMATSANLKMENFFAARVYRTIDESFPAVSIKVRL